MIRMTESAFVVHDAAGRTPDRAAWFGKAKRLLPFARDIALNLSNNLEGCTCHGPGLRLDKRRQQRVAPKPRHPER